MYSDVERLHNTSNGIEETNGNATVCQTRANERFSRSQSQSFHSGSGNNRSSLPSSATYPHINNTPQQQNRQTPSNSGMVNKILIF